MAFPIQSLLKRERLPSDRVLDQDVFLRYLDLEVKRSRRYQNFFCILAVRLEKLDRSSRDTALETCFQRLTHLISDEMRDSDVLGALGERGLGVVLPYADRVAGGATRSRFEHTLEYCDFTRDGWRVRIEQVCFPSDVADTPDLFRKVMGTDIPKFSI